VVPGPNLADSMQIGGGGVFGTPYSHPLAAIHFSSSAPQILRAINRLVSSFLMRDLMAA